MVIVGTSGAEIAWNIAASSGTAGLIGNSSFGGDGGQLNASYVNFTSIAPGAYALLASLNTANGIFSCDHCTLTSSGQVGVANVCATCILSLTYVRAVTSVVSSNKRYFELAGLTAPTGAGVRRFENNYWRGGQLYLSATTANLDVGMTVVGNVGKGTSGNGDDDVPFAISTTPPRFTAGNWANNLFWAELVTVGPFQNTYTPSGYLATSVFLESIQGGCTIDGVNYHWMFTYYYQTTIDGWIFEPDCGSGSSNIIQNLVATAAYANEIKNNIVLGGNGELGANLVDITGSTCNGTTTFCGTWSVHNNTNDTGDSSSECGIAAGEGGNALSGLFSRISSNMFWRSTAGAGCYVGYDVQSAVPPPPTAGVFQNADYNWTYNVTSGSRYRMSGTNVYANPSTPGTHDGTGNPLFVDSTRNFLKWCQSLNGSDTTWANCFAHFEAGTAGYTAQAVIEWIRAGFVPGNASVATGAADGGYIGAVGPKYLLSSVLFPYPTAVPKPAKAGNWVDPVTNQTVTRISDRLLDAPCNGNPTDHNGSEYSTWSPLSSDGNYLMFECGSGGYGIWNAAAPYTFVLDVTTSGSNSENPEYRWDRSGSFPTRIYYRANLELRYFDALTENPTTQYHVAKDFTSYLSGKGVPTSTAFIWNGDEGTASDDSNVWAWMVANTSSHGNAYGVLVWDKNADAMNYKDAVPFHASGFGYPNSVKVSITGNYLLIAWSPDASPFNQQEGNAPWIYDISAHATQDSGSMFSNGGACNGNVPHDAWAITRQGHDALVALQPSGPHNDTLSSYTPHDKRIYEMYRQPSFAPDDMASCGLNQATGPRLKPGWAFMSTYCDNSSAAQLDWAQSQVFAFELDETKCLYYYTAFSQQSNFAGGTQGIACASTPRIWRIAYEQNYTGAAYYYQQPNATIDAGGTRIWFGSNFKSTNVDGDVYQVTLPTTWLEDLNGPTVTSTAISRSGKITRSGK